MKDKITEDNYIAITLEKLEELLNYENSADDHAAEDRTRDLIDYLNKTN